MSNLFELASKLAALEGTQIIPGAYSEGDGKIIFVVEAGKKRTMTEGELIEAINTAQPEEPAFIHEEVGSDGGAVAPPADN